MTCVNCFNVTSNPRFCSRSCATSYNNRLKPKRTAKIKNCVKCGVEFKSVKRTTLCEKHQALTPEDYRNRTLDFYRTKLSVAGSPASWKHVHVRRFAKLWNKDMPKECEYCGYDKHIELAHIRAVSSFPGTATIGEVNSRENLLSLCPNHHWEFDNGHLTFDDINSVR